MKQKVMFTVAAMLLFLAMLPMSVFAHGHGHGGYASGSGDGSSDASYAYDICTVDGCNIVSIHWHDGVCYGGHWLGDGCDYHQLCSVEDCTKVAHHYHDGIAYIPKNNAYSLCAYGDCHVAAPHEHGDYCYAGHWAGDGHSHHQVCAVRNCTRDTVHQHNGATCFPSGRGGGHHRGGNGARRHY